MSWSGGEIPDRLHHWYRPLSVPKGGHTGPQAQHKPLIGPQVTTRPDPEVASMPPQFLHAGTTIPTQLTPHEYYLFTSLQQAVPKKPVRDHV